MGDWLYDIVGIPISLDWDLAMAVLHTGAVTTQPVYIQGEKIQYTNFEGL